MGNEYFLHECRATGQVFKDYEDWWKWLDENQKDVNKAVAEHDGFKYNINDVCLNPHNKASYKIDEVSSWQVPTAKTQYGWIWGYDIKVGGNYYSHSPAYPSRYSNTPFFETETEAIIDGLEFVIHQLEGRPKTKATSMMLYYAKKQKAELEHPQLDLFSNQN